MSNLRVYQQYVDVIGTMDVPNVRVYQQYVDVIGTVDVPALRVSQQNVQVAGTKTGDAQVSRVYLEVLTSYMNYSLESVLSLSGVATAELGDLQGIAESTLSITDSASFIKDIYTGGNTLSLSDDVVLQVILSAPVSNTLTLAQVASGTVGATLPVIDTLELTSVASYIGPRQLSADSELVLTSGARQPDSHFETASSSLSFTGSTTYHGSLYASADSPIVFDQVADTRLKIRRIDHDLELTQTAVGQITKILGNTLTLTSTVVEGIVWKQESQDLVLTQEATSRFSIINIGPGERYPIDVAAIDLVQTVRVYPYYRRSEDTLTFTQDASTTIPYHASAESELQYSEFELNDDDPPTFEEVWYGLDHSVYVVITNAKPLQDYIQWHQEATAVKISGTALSESVTHTLLFNSGTALSTTGVGSSTLSLSQTATAVVGTTASSTLALTDDVSYLFVRNLNLASDLGLKSSFTFLSAEDEVCTFDPTIGSSTDSVPNILLNEPTFTPQDTITLFYPWTSPTNTIELRTPELGNKNRLEFQRINRKTRGGTLIVWADTQWPKNETMVIDVRGMSETKAQELLTFITASLGHEIGITDWEGQTLRAVHMNPDSPITRNKTCDNMAALEFEITWSAIVGASTSSLSLSDTAARELIKASVASTTLSLTSGSVGINT